MQLCPQKSYITTFQLASRRQEHALNSLESPRRFSPPGTCTQQPGISETLLAARNMHSTAWNLRDASRRQEHELNSLDSLRLKHLISVALRHAWVSYVCSWTYGRVLLAPARILMSHWTNVITTAMFSELLAREQSPIYTKPHATYAKRYITKSRMWGDDNPRIVMIVGRQNMCFQVRIVYIPQQL